MEAVGFDDRTFTGLGKQTLGGHKQNLVCTRTQEKGAVTHKRLSQTCREHRGVSSRGVGQQWPATGSGHWLQQCWQKPFDPYHAWPQAKPQERHTALPATGNGLKIYRAWPHPSQQDPDSPTVSLSHQKASTSLSSSSIRGQTE